MNIKHIENRMINLHEEYQQEMRKIEAAIAESKAILDKLLVDMQKPVTFTSHADNDEILNQWEKNNA